MNLSIFPVSIIRLRPRSFRSTIPRVLIAYPVLFDAYDIIQERTNLGKAIDSCQLFGPLVYSCYYNTTSYYCRIDSSSYIKPDIWKCLDIKKFLLFFEPFFYGTQQRKGLAVFFSWDSLLTLSVTEKPRL